MIIYRTLTPRQEHNADIASFIMDRFLEAQKCYFELHKQHDERVDMVQAFHGLEIALGHFVDTFLPENEERLSEWRKSRIQYMKDHAPHRSTWEM